jgi:vacuolar-type H+-ATPase catalytic subunit A/Vma1
VNRGHRVPAPVGVAVMTAGPPGGDFVGAVETVTGTVTTFFLGLV